MVNIVLTSVGVMLILVISAFGLYMVFLPLARTIIGGLQIMDILVSRKLEASAGSKQVQPACDCPRAIWGQAAIPYMPPVIPLIRHYMW
jgi:hypothetical protein